MDTRNYKSPALLMATLLTALAFLSACTSYQSPEDMRKALARAATGQGREVAREILENYKDIPAVRKMDTMDVVAKVPGPQANQVLRRLLDDPALTPPQKRKVADVLMKRNETGTPQLIQQKIQKQDPVFFNDKTADYLVKTMPEKAPAEIHAAIKKDPKRMSKKYVRYFAGLKYKPAVPMLQKSLDEGKMIPEVLKALREMKDEAISKYLLGVAANAKHPARMQVFETLLAGTQEEQTAASKIVRDILVDHASRPELEVLRAIDLVPAMPGNVEAFKELEKIYRTTRNPEYRTRALNSLAKMQKTDPYLLAREIHTPLIAYQTGFALYRPDSRRPEPKKRTDVARRGGGETPKGTGGEPTNRKIDDPDRRDIVGPVARKKTEPKKEPGKEPKKEPKKEEPKKTVKKEPTDIRPKTVTRKVIKKKRRTARRRVRKRRARRARPPATGGPGKSAAFRLRGKGEYPATSAAYRAEIAGYLRRSMPPNNVTRLLWKLNNSLRQYANFTSTSRGRFVLRSYRNEFGGAEEKLKQYLGQGMRKPGSLNAVLRNVVLEYPSDEMRVFAISEIFSIPRWQSLVLLDYIKGR